MAYPLDKRDGRMAGSEALWQARLLFAHSILRQRHDGMSTRKDDDMHGHARRVHAPWSASV